MRLASRIVGGISIASFVAGGALIGASFAINASNERKEPCYTEMCNFNMSGLGEMIGGLSAIALGGITGITSLGLYLGADAKDKEHARRIEISPYVNPVMKKNEASANASIDGAVVGLKGTF
jgi:hypothetical protein